MTHLIHISKLSEVKSVFNSPSDNEQYFRVLKNSGLNKIENVELAQPTVRQSNFSIIWKCDESGTLTNFQELPESLKQKVGADLEIFYKIFKEKSLHFRNVPSNFSNQIIQIPSLSSIFVNKDSWKIVLVNWGFLEDSFNRMDGVINTLFPRQSNSILVKVVNQFDEPLSNLNLNFTTSETHQSTTTNSKGYAKFNNLLVGQAFNLVVSQDSQVIQEDNFICDGRVEYVVVVCLNSAPDSKPQISNPTGDNPLQVNLEEPITIDAEPSPINIRFVNGFNRPIKNVAVHLNDSLGTKFEKQTNNNGGFTIFSEASSIRFDLKWNKEDWTQDLDIEKNKSHIIRLKSKFPWLWWLLITFLILLFLCCLFGSCDCSLLNRHSLQTTQAEPLIDTLTDNNPIKPCNAVNNSGGAGVTITKHFLGKQNGKVTLSFNMYNQPDKLELFYEGELVASTFDVVGNKNGFFGADIGGSGEGYISFNYEFNRDDFCEVHVTGPLNTSWEYSLNCPQ